MSGKPKFKWFVIPVASVALFAITACVFQGQSTTTASTSSSVPGITPTVPTTMPLPPSTSSSSLGSPVGLLVVKWPPVQLVVTDPQIVVEALVSPGATVVIGNESFVTSADPESVVSVGGQSAVHVRLDLELQEGVNQLTISAEAPGGSTATAVLTVTVLPDAVEQFTYISRVSPTELEVDYAEYLLEDEALAAAREDGVIGPDEFLLKAYYVRNPDSVLHTLPAIDSPKVLLNTPDGSTDVLVEFDRWLSFFDQGRPWSAELAPIDEQFIGPAVEGTPYWLVIHDGRVVQIRQQFQE